MYPKTEITEESGITIDDIEKALYFSFIVTYSQGMSQLAAASDEYDYGLNMQKISKIWRGGCIIRAALLENMRQAYHNDSALVNLLLHESFEASPTRCGLIGHYSLQPDRLQLPPLTLAKRRSPSK